ncbi:MAG: hypothetical protein PVH85_04770 [Desulfobacterales bacterium]|jgi:hypothetical protein
MGNTNPLNIKKGGMKEKFVIMACCRVLETVYIKSPMPYVEIFSTVWRFSSDISAWISLAARLYISSRFNS